MLNSLLAILSRFDGNKTLAMVYCADMARDYPHLRREYTQHLESLLDMEG